MRQMAFAPQTPIVAGVNARHRQRLAQQIPQGWPGELAEDVAVFDDSALAAQPTETALQVEAVRDALREATESRGDEALKRVSTIPRGSPLSEWRLFVRGLVDWLAGRTESAGEAWVRLDSERRPGRIATSMLLASNSDLENASPTPESSEHVPPEAMDGARGLAWSRFDAQQLYHAKLLWKQRFDRPALRVAEAGLKVREESDELLLGPSKMRWLQQFNKEFEDTEPDLVAALSQAALSRAFRQDFFDLFDEAVLLFPGPRHDRRSRVLTYLFHSQTSNQRAHKRAEAALDEYLKRDLPQNESLSAPLRRAIASQIHLYEAAALMADRAEGGIFDFLKPPEETQTIRKHLLAAVQSEPANGPAYEIHAQWIKAKLEIDRLGKAERTSLENELAEVMRRWSQGLPDAVEPRLWLVEHLLENDHLEEARPHVEFLSASRHDDPRVRAMPWKWQLLEVMRLCRRKAWLAEVPAHLDEAEKLWPVWLPRLWLPYLRAAWTLRMRQMEAFEEQRSKICEASGRERDSLADACMMLGAAQQMQTGAADLKPFRQAVDQKVKNLKSLAAEDLIDTGAFFWDLHRAQLLYPAYRMHGANIGKEFTSRLKAGNPVRNDFKQDERFYKAVLWGSEHRFWPNGSEFPFTDIFSASEIQSQPLLAAAQINALLNRKYEWSIEKLAPLGPALRAAASSQSDVFYRHWFVKLADALETAVTRQDSQKSIFGGMFGGQESDDDVPCDCPKCRAARRAQQQGEPDDILF